MNAKVFLLCFVSASTAFAADPPSRFSTTVRTPIEVTESERFQKLLAPRKDIPVIAIGRSDFVFSGPLVQGFRRLPHEENLSRGQKFLRLPLIRLFVPGPMERPPETGGRYFAWRSEEQPVPWILAASRPGISKGPELTPAVRGDSGIQRGLLDLQLQKH